MTMCFGSFLLQHLPTDAIDTEAQCLAVLEQFANRGLCPMFREIIKGRVVEFRYDSQTKTTSQRWLEGADADLVLSLEKSGNCVPASWLVTVSGLGPVLIPEALKRGSVSLKLGPGNVLKLDTSGASSALAYIQNTRERLMQMSAEEVKSYLDPLDSREELVVFYDELSSGIEACRKAGVLYIMCDLF